MNRFSMVPIITCWILCAASSVQADTSPPAVSIKTWLNHDSTVVPGQQLTLNIEIATSGWFTAGTRIAPFELAHAIVLQREPFAVNGTQQRDQETWAVQLWQIQLYPQVAGDYALASIAVDVMVANANGPQKYTLNSQPLNFSLTKPTELQMLPAWIASPRYRVDQHFNRSLNGLTPGDAIERTIIQSANDMAGMMLPDPAIGSQSGLAAYPKLPVIEDQINRGEFLAQRTDKIVYLAESSGSMTLPALTFYWWDTHKKQLTEIILPRQTLIISARSPTESFIRYLQSNKLVLFLSGLFLTLILIARHRLKKSDVQARLSTLRTAKRRRAIKSALMAGQYQQACSLLYQWLDQSEPKTSLTTAHEVNRYSLRAFLSGTSTAPTLELLLQSSFSSGTSEPLSGDQILQLLKYFNDRQRYCPLDKKWLTPPALHLN